jgi:hypothetical protein
MRKFELNVPRILGAGIGLLVSGRIPPERRRAFRLALLGIGVASTIRAVRAMIRGRKQPVNRRALAAI